MPLSTMPVSLADAYLPPPYKRDHHCIGVGFCMGVEAGVVVGVDGTRSLLFFRWRWGFRYFFIGVFGVGFAVAVIGAVGEGIRFAAVGGSLSSAEIIRNASNSYESVRNPLKSSAII